MMRLLELESPRVLPDFVACCSARLVDGDPALSFAAGRECAARALMQLGVGAGCAVPRGAGGEPVWPEGVSGSITHKDDYFWVAVARRSDAISLGIDVERIIDDGRAQRIEGIVVLPQERRLGSDAISMAQRVSLLFSVKEAAFKCLYPLVLRRFYYDALAVTALDVELGTFEAELIADLSPQFPSGRVLSGRLELEPHRVCAGICVPSQ